MCWYPSVTYHFGWIYPLLLQWKSHCSSTVFLHRFSTSFSDDQLAKFFYKALNYTDPALREGWTSRGPFQPKLLCDSGILCPVPSMQWSSWRWCRVSRWWPGSWFRAEQSNCASLRMGSRSSEPVGLAEENGVEESWVRNWSKYGEDVDLWRAVRVSTQPPPLFSSETKSWYFCPLKGTCGSILFPTPSQKT